MLRQTQEQGQQIETVMNKVNVTPVISMIALNINGLNIPKKKDCQNGSKNKTQLYVVCKKPM